MTKRGQFAYQPYLGVRVDRQIDRHGKNELMNMSAPVPLPLTNTAATCQVFLGKDLRVISGANQGDCLEAFDDLCEGDVYHLSEGAAMWRLAVDVTPEGITVAQGSEVGTPGTAVELSGRLTFMVSQGDPVEAVLVNLPGLDNPIFLLPTAPIEPRVDLNLIGKDSDAGDVRLSDLLSYTFLRGTEITLANGQQCAVEDLRVGDRILTRDHGPQPLRWIGRQTVRAVGAYAPVVVSKGALGNAADLVISQHQRLFVYQRGPDRLAQTAEILVKADALVDDDKIFLRKGGFADFFSLVFDHHAVIYAECIPVESLQISAATRAALPEDAAAEVAALVPDQDQAPAFGTELQANTLDAITRARLLKDGNS